MKKRSFGELLYGRWAEGLHVCVGLDTDFSKIPRERRLSDELATIYRWNQDIIDQTRDIVCAYKPNLAFYLAYGGGGLNSLMHTIRYIHEAAPNVPIILDGKWADIGNTNEGYVTWAFKDLDVDAVTVHPYLGKEALAPFLKYGDKGIFVLCKTSNPGSGEFQNLAANGKPLYQTVAANVMEQWNEKGNCGLVVGATYPEELADVRKIAGESPLLIPGLGAQGGDVRKTVQAGKNSSGRGMIINSSRDIIFSPDPRAATQKLNDQITSFL